MSQENKTITCPNCAYELDVSEILYEQLNAQLKQKYREDLARATEKFAEDRKRVASEREALENERAALEEQIAEQVKAGIAGEKSRLEERIRRQIEDDQAERLKELKAELDRRSAQVRELNKTRAEVERLKREKAELRDAITLENEKKISETLAAERRKIQQQESDRATLAISERDIVIRQLKDQLKEASKKAEQGSMQLQGEAQELAIEEWLAAEFPLDTIEEIKKGARGADCLQIVNTHTRRNCGSIYYESKRTKAFGGNWIEKFKEDIRARGATVGVLVTETMPNGMNHLGLVDGVWVCGFSEFRGLAQILRESVIQLARAVATQENRGDKMEMLYGFLTSDEFRHQVEGIVEGFTQMQADLESEKRAMQGIWKKREKQIQKVLLNTNNMYSSVKGIAGSAVQSVPQLELSAPDDES